MSDLSNPFVMLTYYRRLFPFDTLFKWLNHDPTSLFPLHVLCPLQADAFERIAEPTQQFTHREFAMNLPNEVYIRYCSYANAEEMKKDVIRLNPARFEIGPVYTGRVRSRFERRAQVGGRRRADAFAMHSRRTRKY